MMPASNMKIVTLAAAAEQLGWDYTLRDAAAGAPDPIDGGVARGRPRRRRHRAIRASAPSTAWRIDVFGDWAERLKQRGIRAIDGRIIGDDNAFDDDELGFGWSWDDLPDDYAAGVERAAVQRERRPRRPCRPVRRRATPPAVSVDPPEQRPRRRRMRCRPARPGTATSLTHASPARQR